MNTTALEEFTSPVLTFSLVNHHPICRRQFPRADTVAVSQSQDKNKKRTESSDTSAAHLIYSTFCYVLHT